VGLSTQLSATGNFADGSTQDFTKTVSWGSSQLPVGTISSTGAATSHAQGATTITAMLSTFNTSTTLTVIAPTLVSAVIAPGAAFLPPGTSQQFTATGTYSDGNSQDITSIASWSSSAPNIASINSSGLLSAVSAGTATISASSGNHTFVTNVTVTAPGPPSIAASVFPAPNVAGWNNSPVTVTFTCTPGSALITSCPPPQVVPSEGTGQIVSGTVTDSSGNTASTSVTLNIDETPPVLAVSSPSDGSTFSAATLTTTGSVSDTLSGSPALTCNGAPVTVTGDSFSCNISLNPGLNLIAVRATDVAGNVALTKMHVTYNVYPIPTSIRITPTNVSLAVGQTQQFTAIDDQGHPRPDATWALPKRTTLATITTDSSPVLTGDAVGQVALTATVQGISVQTTINVVSTGGSVNWTVPPLPGLAIAADDMGHFAPNLPSDNGVGLYSVEAGSNGHVLRGLTGDGRQLWQQPLTTKMFGPDSNGGILTATADLDGQTGSALWANSFQFTVLAVRPDGKIVAVGADPQQGPGLMVFFVDNATGQVTKIPFPDKSDSITTRTGCTSAVFPSDYAIGVQGVAADADGNAYMEYLVTTIRETQTYGGTPCILIDDTAISSTKLVLMTVFADGSTSTRTLATRTFASINSGRQWSGSFLVAGNVTPDGSGGVLATWLDGQSYMVSHVSASGQSDFRLGALDNTNPYRSPNGIVVLDDSGTGFVTGDSGPTVPNTIIAFDINSGQPIWTAQAGLVLSDIFAQDGGGVIVKGFDNNSNNWKVTTIDASGNVGPLISTDPVLTDDWSAGWFSAGQAGVSSANLPLVVNQASLWPETAGNPSQNGFGAAGCPCLNQTSDSTLPSQPQSSSAIAAESGADSETAQVLAESTPNTQLSGPSNCPICNLPQPEPPQCVTFPGTGSTYLILVGDSGLLGHDLGDLFNLAAQTKANELQAQGNRVIACRISSDTDFNAELTGYGLITGDVIYFGHSGEGNLQVNGGKVSVTGLFVGKDPTPDSNILAYNSGPGSYRNLCGVGCSINNYLSATSAIRLNGCKAGAAILDFYKQYKVAIAQLISQQLNRGVYAYTVGIYFSQLDAAHDPLTSGTDATKNPPDALPMYAVPEGPPGHKPQPKSFCPGGNCQ
jgi:hypothetical protein